MLRVAALSLALLAPLTGGAAPVTVELEGVFQFLSRNDFSIEPSIEPGEAISGSLVYDDSVAAGPCATPFQFECMLYQFAADPMAGISFESESGEFSFAGSNAEAPAWPLEIEVVDDGGFDSYHALWGRSLEIEGETRHQVDWVRLSVASRERGEGLFSGGGLQVPNLDNAFHASLEYIPRLTESERIVIINGRPRLLREVAYTELIFSVSSLRLVPEPSALSLLGLATLGLLAARRRRQ